MTLAPINSVSSSKFAASKYHHRKLISSFKSVVDNKPLKISEISEICGKKTFRQGGKG